ncbi:MAG TPA: NAD(P)/FAD-dependent oxidoreductase [Chitinophagaceae bacterium]|nr:NAD(P)/FAD-dependent oxidoreductase [Chitinophagaceae bacterium]
MRLSKKDYDAIVIGSGPNGLAAAITLQQANLRVLLVEAKKTIGGGLRSAKFTLPGFSHDVCSAVHPMAAVSPFFQSVPLNEHGLEFINPPILLAHPLDNGNAVVFRRSMQQTAEALAEDYHAYLDLIKPVVDDWPGIVRNVLGPLHFPKRPVAMARFGIRALRSANHVAKRFHSVQAKALWGGMAAHAMQPLSCSTTSAVALVLMAAGHTGGWPIAKGGSNAIADALASYFVSLGGVIETDFYVRSLSQLPSSNAILFDVTPKQLLDIAGHKFSSLYRWQLKRYRYGMGVFKIDWALDRPIPFAAVDCLHAGTIHLGNTLGEIATSEELTSQGKHPEKPFVLLAQPSLFDSSRAPDGKQTAWAYCHVPNGSKEDMTDRIEKQVERFAPGFRDTIAARHVMNTEQMEEYNSNYVGGDINGGLMNLSQLFTRPALRLSPYRTSAKGIYICSSSTPPGGGTHGMCGYSAARKALRDIFKKTAAAV